jgi:pantoate--beta-alanine ligase
MPAVTDGEVVTDGEMVLVRSRAELAAARGVLPGPVGLVATMGALHDGHAALIRAALSECASVVVSVFVNPMQFNEAADLERYPQPIEADIERCRELGVGLLWNPSVRDVYPDGPVLVRVTAGELANQLEGPNRPGHFDGVLTVVAKLFGLVWPDRAYFGEKDYQQLVLIRRMVTDLEIPVQVFGVPTARDPDGLALSSRNVFLSGPERIQALGLSHALGAGVESAAGGAGADTVLSRARAVLAAYHGVQVEYLEMRDPALEPAPKTGPARLLVAARIGTTRLIDNVGIELKS